MPDWSSIPRGELEVLLWSALRAEERARERMCRYEDLLREGARGFSRILISTSDDAAVSDWQKRVRAALKAHNAPVKAASVSESSLEPDVRQGD